MFFEFFDLSKAGEVPNDAMAFSSRGSHHNSGVHLKWTDPKVDGACRAFCHSMGEILKEMETRDDGGAEPAEGSRAYPNDVERMWSHFRSRSDALLTKL